MVDLDAVLTQYLNSRSELTDVVEKRIWISMDAAEDYNPAEDGPALIGQRRGGLQSFSSVFADVNYQFRCFGKDEIEAASVAMALHAALNDKRGPGILYARMDQVPTPLRDPDTEWVFELAYYTVTMFTAE